MGHFEPPKYDWDREKHNEFIKRAQEEQRKQKEFQDRLGINSSNKKNK
jgi:hypothetical protein